eukprot:GHVO01070058.1.p1 GENE.GHVO01070058.1~~GHVO01070058.1.p1  ORF type:complete len:242 (+),score=71.06 GHVO01070058.1:33-728(+)
MEEGGDWTWDDFLGDDEEEETTTKVTDASPSVKGTLTAEEKRILEQRRLEEEANQNLVEDLFGVPQTVFKAPERKLEVAKQVSTDPFEKYRLSTLEDLESFANDLNRRLSKSKANGQAFYRFLTLILTHNLGRVPKVNMKTLQTRITEVIEEFEKEERIKAQREKKGNSHRDMARNYEEELDEYYDDYDEEEYDEDDAYDEEDTEPPAATKPTPTPAEVKPKPAESRTIRR